MSVNREIIESPMRQGIDEVVTYTLNTLPWGGVPTSVSVAVYDETERLETDVTTEVMPVNTPSVSGDVITLSSLTPLAIGDHYRVEVKWVKSGNTLEAYCIIDIER